MVLIRGDAGRKCEMRLSSAGGLQVPVNVILAQSASFASFLLSPTLLTWSSQSCRFSHDIHAYLDAKPEDIFFPSASMLNNDPPFVSLPSTDANEMERPEESSVILCPVFEAMGSCRLGLKCRFLGAHVRKAEDGTVALVEDEEKKTLTLAANTEHNSVSPVALKLLRTKKVEFFPQMNLEVCNETPQYPTPVADVYLQELKATAEGREGKENRLGVSAEGDSTTITADHDVELEEPCIEESILPSAAAESVPTKLSPDEVHAQADLPDVPFRFAEKRRLNWSNKTCMWSLSDTLARDKQIPIRFRTVDYRRKSGECYDRFSSRYPLNSISSPLDDFASHLVLTLPAVKVSVCCAGYSRRVQGTVSGLGNLFPCRF